MNRLFSKRYKFPCKNGFGKQFNKSLRINFCGFTLIELLIALSIFSVVMVMATVGFRTILDLKTHLQDKTQYLRDIQFALFMLERDFTQIIQYGNGKKIPSLHYQGPSTIQLIRMGVPNPLARHKRSTVQKIEYNVSGDELIRTTYDHLLSGDKNEAQMRAQTILTDVEEFEVRFWTKDRGWVEQWPEDRVREEQAVNSQPIRIMLPKAIIFTLKIKKLGELSRVFYVPLGSYVIPQ